MSATVEIEQRSENDISTSMGSLVLDFWDELRDGRAGYRSANYRALLQLSDLD